MKTLLFLPVAALPVLLAACGDDGPGGDATPPNTVLNSAQASSTAQLEVTTIDTSDWPEIADNDGSFTLLYPADWFVAPEGNRVASFDVGPAWTDSLFPPDGVLVDFTRFPADALDERPDDARDASLGGADGWQITEQNEGGGGDADWTYRRAIVVTRDDWAYTVYGAFKDPHADEAIFEAILDSFEFTD